MTSTVSLTKALLFILVATIMTSSTAVNAVTDITKFAGEWKIVEVFDSVDDDSTSRELPSSVGHPLVFKMTISEKNPDDTLNLGCKVGNSMRTSVKVLSEDDSNDTASIQVGLVMSTMMMPPEDQYDFELFLSGALPKLTTMTLSGDGQGLVMKGESKVVLQAVDISNE